MVVENMYLYIFFIKNISIYINIIIYLQFVKLKPICKFVIGLLKILDKVI